MPTFSDFNSLFKHLEKQKQSVLKNELARTTVKTMQKNIQEEVYNVYDPVMYERKEYDGGLIDQENIEIEIVDDNTISVENIRFDRDRDVAAIVESGQGYKFDFEFNGVSRPFTEQTRQDMKGKMGLIMKEALIKRGLNVK